MKGGVTAELWRMGDAEKAWERTGFAYVTRARMEWGHQGSVDPL